MDFKRYAVLLIRILSLEDGPGSAGKALPRLCGAAPFRLNSICLWRVPLFLQPLEQIRACNDIEQMGDDIAVVLI